MVNCIHCSTNKQHEEEFQEEWKCLTCLWWFSWLSEIKYLAEVGDTGLYSFQWTEMKNISVMLYKQVLKIEVLSVEQMVAKRERQLFVSLQYNKIQLSLVEKKINVLYEIVCSVLNYYLQYNLWIIDFIISYLSMFYYKIIYIYHHHHFMSLAQISLTLSRHFSLSFITSGRFSQLHPISSHSCCMYVWAGRPAFAWPYAGVHWSTSLMSSSLLLQQCPACLVRLAWIVFM